MILAAWLARNFACRRCTWLALLAATLLAVLYALTMFNLSFVLGTGPFWHGPRGDRVTNLIGALYYLHDPWRLPIFYVPKLGFPEGVNIVYTDSLPLVALAFKLIYKLSGSWFNYFGLWVFLCFPLLGFFAALAAKAAGFKDAAAIVAAGLLAIACPAFLLRFMHLALMGHFLIVWSIYLYFRLRACPSSVSAILQFCIVSAMAVLLQAYFLMMVLPFLAAALAQSIVEKQLSFSRAATALGSLGATLLAVGLLAGIIGPGAPRATAEGFGYWSMNVLSPLIPPHDHLPEFLSRFIHWDQNGLTWDANTGQYEGYSYLGGGVLLLALINLAASGRLALNMVARHGFLALLLGGYFLVAVSNQIFVGDWLAVSFRLPPFLENLVSYFRVGGRFFWPVYYVVMLALVQLTFQRFDPRLARVLVLAAVALQLADTQLLRGRIAAEARQGYPQTLPKDWQPLLAAHGFFKQYPSFQCGGWAGTWPGNDENMELLWEVAKLDKPTNSAYLGRNNRDCINELNEGLKFEIQPDGLYVFAGDFPIVSIKDAPSFETLCREFSRGVVCSHKWDALPQLAVSSTFKPTMHSPIAAYTLGETVNFSSGGTGRPFLAYGWSHSESSGTWSIGRKSEVVLGVPRTTSDATLTVLATAFVHPSTPAKEFRVSVNGRYLGTWTFAVGEVPAKRSIAIPKDLLVGEPTLRIAFEPNIIETPAQFGSLDTRPISLKLVELTVSAEEHRN